MQLLWKALVLRFGPEASDAAALVVGVEGQVQADGIVDAVDETHSEIGLFLHVVSPFASWIIVIDAGSGQNLAAPMLRTYSFLGTCSSVGWLLRLTRKNLGCIISPTSDLQSNQIIDQAAFHNRQRFCAVPATQ
jgi:hypothetical protein